MPSKTFLEFKLKFGCFTTQQHFTRNKLEILVQFTNLIISSMYFIFKVKTKNTEIKQLNNQEILVPVIAKYLQLQYARVNSYFLGLINTIIKFHCPF